MSRLAPTAAFLAVALAGATTAWAWPLGPTVALRMAGALAGQRPRELPAERFAGAREIRGREAPGFVAFTFDDGPHRATTPKVLAALDRHEVVGTFFVNGYRFDDDTRHERDNAEVLRAMAAGGHLVGNHTFHHERLEHASAIATAETVLENERLLARELPARARLFRAPYGKLSAAARQLLADLGYTVVRWNIDPADFNAESPEQTRDWVLESLAEAGGGVIVLHDPEPGTVKAVPLLLKGLEQLNCRRMAADKPPLLPVPLDYFARDARGRRLPLHPDAVAAAERSRARLARVCKRTPPPLPPAADAVDSDPIGL